MLTVHHLGISQSDHIVWLCEELEIPCNLVRYERDPLTRLAPDTYKALHPFGTAPVITDGDVVLGESAAIIEYIMGRYSDGSLRVSPDEPNYAEYLFWFHCANGSVVPAGMTDLITALLTNGADAETTRPLRARGDRAFAMIEQRLGKARYFASEKFTGADIMMVFPLTTMRLFVPRDLAPYPNIQAYLQRIGARPAFQRAMIKADPDLPPQLN